MLQGCATTLGAHPQGEDIKGFLELYATIVKH